MYNFKEYIKFPLIFNKKTYNVLTNDGIEILTCIDNKSVSYYQDLVDKINGYSKKVYNEQWKINDDVFITYENKKIFFVRGHYHLTTKHNLEHTSAMNMQKEFAKYIINNLNRK